MNKAKNTAKLNDKLRRTMPMGKFDIQMSEIVSASPERSKIIQAVKKYERFDAELDINGDHSIGLVVVEEKAYIFRFTYGDARYDYSLEVGQRTLSIMHATEFRSLKLGRQVQTSVRRALEPEVNG